MTKTCAICGKTFDVATTATVCGVDCRKILKDQIKRRWYENHKELTVQRAANWKKNNLARHKQNAKKRYYGNLAARREYNRIKGREYRLKNPEKYRLANARNWKRHREKYQVLIRCNTARYISEMSDNYIRSKLEMTKAICPPELIAAKRAHLKLKRLLKQTKTKI